MALTVSSDLSVSVSTEQNVVKLTDKEEALRRSIYKGDPKALGISQVMLGFVIISYSVPLLSSDLTEVFKFGVPWWSGITFITAGTVALVMERRKTSVLVFACMVVTIAAAFIAIIAAVIYIVDITMHQASATCEMSKKLCAEKRYVAKLNVEMKSIHLCLHLLQAGVAAAFSFILYRERNNFIYAPVI